RTAPDYAGDHAWVVLLRRRRGAAPGADRRICRGGGHWMTERWTLAVVLLLAAVLAGCQTSIPGTPVINPTEPTEPSFPTSRPTRPPAAPPTTVQSPTPRSHSAAPR